MDRIAQQEISSSSSLYNLFRLPKRNLGHAILAAAIADYQSTDDQTRANAALFLFPTSPEYREHYDWVVAMADGVNRAWLREALDSAKKRWDLERGLAARGIGAMRGDSFHAAPESRALEERGLGVGDVVSTSRARYTGGLGFVVDDREKTRSLGCAALGRDDGLDSLPHSGAFHG